MPRGSGLTGLKYNITSYLEAITGKGPMSRPQIIKHVWEHIKKYNLQSMKDKRIIVPDSALAEVTGKASFSMMKLPSKLNAHIKERV
jgi:DNA topoisomerase-3